MPRNPQGLKPIGESVKKIVERIRKEREERQKKSASPRTQPKLPGMKNGGGADARNPSIKEYANILKDKDRLTEADMKRARKRLMSNDPRYITAARDQVKAVKKRKQKKKDDDKIKASLREISARELKSGGLIGGQKKLDANKDGKISGEDFKILRGKKNKMRGGGIAIKGTNFKGVY